MNENISQQRDNIETAILLALSAGKKSTGVKKPKISKVKSSFREELDLGMFCPKKREYPESVYTMDMSADDRVYSASMDDIVVDPGKAIGRGLEAGMLCEDGSFKWTKVSPMPAPKGLIAMSNKPVSWFMIQYREIKEGRTDNYAKRPMPLSGGRVPLMKCLIGNGFNARQQIDELEEQLAIALSVFEDATRSNSYLATVEEETKLRFPVGQDAYKDFFRIRDGYRNTPTGRKNPILHWCSKHIRSRGDSVFEVTGHERGAETMVVGPMRLSIERNRGYSHLLAAEQNGTET